MTRPIFDRIAKEGVRCLPITMRSQVQPLDVQPLLQVKYPIRSGMTTVGRPGSPLGYKAATPTLAESLKPLGYMSGQFGKNHLGDRNDTLTDSTWF